MSLLLRILPVLTLSLLACGSAPAASDASTVSKRRALAEGDWGGPHIQMTVGPQGATIELDCAHGAITEPIVVGRNGRFRVSGTYSPEHGGPVREEDETGRPAVYTGRLEGESLRLGIAYEGGEDVGTFELVHGRTGRITKCL
jgi:hypothetical protein